MSTLYEWLELELDAYGVGYQFTATELADEAGYPVSYVSGLIQSYLRAQRRANPQTRYVLVRSGRTRAAVWTVGKRAGDTRAIVKQFTLDAKTTIRQAVKPDLDRIGALNPRARAVISQQLEPLLDGLGSILDGILASVTSNGSTP